MSHPSLPAMEPHYAIVGIHAADAAQRNQITGADIVVSGAGKTFRGIMARPRKPTPKRNLTATVQVMKTTNKKTPWLLHCSKHGKVSEHSNWTQAAAARWRHQGQHRS